MRGQSFPERPHRSRSSSRPTRNLRKERRFTGFLFDPPLERLMQNCEGVRNLLAGALIALMSTVFDILGMVVVGWGAGPDGIRFNSIALAESV